MTHERDTKECIATALEARCHVERHADDGTTVFETNLYRNSSARPQLVEYCFHCPRRLHAHDVLARQAFH